ncbi:MAG: hypothetical protein JTT11_08480 [Candidatus Brockarchaeota archaeon]|nr:hypothetical protein [Candidatus Brockarchaeota archaeon]
MSSPLEEFLDSQAKKNPIRFDKTKLSWEEKGAQDGKGAASSNLLDAIYLRKPPEETVVVERSVAALIQERISNLEEEITRLRARVRLLKIAILVFFVGTMGLVAETIALLRG